MIVVDSSVWIDYFNGVETRETALLNGVLGVEPVMIGDLIPHGGLARLSRRPGC